MATYFFDWEIRDQNGFIVKWCNTLSDADEHKSPVAVFTEAKASVYADMEIPETYSIRAVTFLKI